MDGFEKSLIDLPARLAALLSLLLTLLYLRLWAAAVMALIVGVAIYTLYRYRLEQLLALERVRMRIAHDLHDDIGSNLSRIAMLSEVIRQQISSEDAGVSERLGHIAQISRESVDALSDIVWAIAPDKDRLSDLTQRMRRVADDFCQASGIDFQFQADFVNRELKLGADLRREILLIFKESINNIARHSKSATVEADFGLVDDWLVLQICDDGCGIDLDCANNGNGLCSMRQRAECLGGKLEIISRDRAGTTVRLKIPAYHRARLRKLHKCVVLRP